MRVRGTKEYDIRAIHIKNLARWHALSFFRANIFKACLYFDSASIINTDREIAIELEFFFWETSRKKIHIYIRYVYIYICVYACVKGYIITISLQWMASLMILKKITLGSVN